MLCWFVINLFCQSIIRLSPFCTNAYKHIIMTLHKSVIKRSPSLQRKCWLEHLVGRACWKLAVEKHKFWPKAQKILNRNETNHFVSSLSFDYLFLKFHKRNEKKKTFGSIRKHRQNKSVHFRIKQQIFKYEWKTLICDTESHMFWLCCKQSQTEYNRGFKWKQQVDIFIVT